MQPFSGTSTFWFEPLSPRLMITCMPSSCGHVVAPVHAVPLEPPALHVTSNALPIELLRHDVTSKLKSCTPLELFAVGGPQSVVPPVFLIVNEGVEVFESYPDRSVMPVIVVPLGTE